MKRRLAKLVVFLLLGAVVNVAVAWGCAAWSDPRDSYHFVMSYYSPRNESLRTELSWIEGTEWAPSTEWHAVATEPLVALGLRRVAFYELPVNSGGGTGQREPFVVRTQAGWPALSVTGAVWFPWVKRARPQVAGFGKIQLSQAIGIEIDVDDVFPDPPNWPHREHRALPYAPIWPGFAINTIFYAAILWLPFGPFQLRRYVRRKRGRCIKCGYDLRGHSGGEVCPECGS